MAYSYTLNPCYFIHFYPSDGDKQTFNTQLMFNIKKNSTE